MSSDRIAKVWKDIRHEVGEALPEYVRFNHHKMAGLLQGLLDGTFDLWFIVDHDEDNNRTKILGHMITRIVEDKLMSSKFLDVFTLWAEDLPVNVLNDGYEIIEQYARNHGCSSMVTDTCNKFLIRIAQRFGFNTDYTRLIKELEN